MCIRDSIGSISGPNDPDPNNGMSLYDSFIKFSEKSSNPDVYKRQVQYNGETYHLKSYAPPGIKDLKSLRYKYTLTFVSEREDLKFYPFSNIIKLTDGTLQTIGMKFAFLADLTEFVGRLRDNLAYYRCV